MIEKSKTKYPKFAADRAKYPLMKDGKPQFDLSSGKYLKLWQGPQHPGVTGNMSLEIILSGDEVIDLKTHVGYLHRGFEKLMERRLYIQCFPIVCRICVPEPDTNEYCFAAATEDLAGIKIPEKAEWLRTLNLEMSRIVSFLMWIGGQVGALGMGIVGQWAVAERDLWLDLFEELTGGRIYHMYMIPGGVRADVPEGFRKRVYERCETTKKLLDDIEKVMLNNSIVKSRLIGLGPIDSEMIDAYGIVGPNARACGFKRDVRKDTAYLKYPELDFEVVTETASDAYGRTLVRYREMYQSISILEQIMKKMPEGGEYHKQLPNVLHWQIPAGETYIKAESTRGEYGFYMVSDGTAYPRRIAVRGPSYSHAISLFEDMAINVSISDIAALMVSLHTYPPEIER